ncbi:MAG: hypothetical protein R2769_10760 [Saprospiraceae bacterium]
MLGGRRNCKCSASGGTMLSTIYGVQGFNGPNPTNLPAGFHTVTVTDGDNNTATDMVNITQPSVIVTTISQSNIDCNTIWFCYGHCNWWKWRFFL